MSSLVKQPTMISGEDLAGISSPNTFSNATNEPKNHLAQKQSQQSNIISRSEERKNQEKNDDDVIHMDSNNQDVIKILGTPENLLTVSKTLFYQLSQAGLTYGKLRPDEEEIWNRAMKAFQWTDPHETKDGPSSKKEHPRVFLAVDNPFRCIYYRTFFSNFGCLVESCCNLQRAPAYAAPKHRSIENPSLFDFIIFEKTMKNSYLDSNISDFCFAVRDSDKKFTNKTKFKVRSNIIAIVGAEESGKEALYRGADLFLRRPLIAHEELLRKILLPEILNTKGRCKIFLEPARFEKMSSLFMEVYNKPIATADQQQSRASEAATNIDASKGAIPVLKDDQDGEEIKYLQDSVKVRDKEINKLRQKVKQLGEELEQERNDAKHAKLSVTSLEQNKNQEIENLQKQVTQVKAQNTHLQDIVDRLSAIEKQRREEQAALVSQTGTSDREKQIELQLRRRIENLTSELEREKRINVRQAAQSDHRRNRVSANNDAQVQAGSGVIMFYNMKKDAGSQCEILAQSHLEKFKKAHRDAQKMIEALMEDDKNKTIQRRQSLSGSRRDLEMGDLMGGSHEGPQSSSLLEHDSGNSASNSGEVTRTSSMRPGHHPFERRKSLIEELGSTIQGHRIKDLEGQIEFMTEKITYLTKIKNEFENTKYEKKELEKTVQMLQDYVVEMDEKMAENNNLKTEGTSTKKDAGGSHLQQELLTKAMKELSELRGRVNEMEVQNTNLSKENYELLGLQEKLSKYNRVMRAVVGLGSLRSKAGGVTQLNISNNKESEGQEHRFTPKQKDLLCHSIHTLEGIVAQQATNATTTTTTSADELSTSVHSVDQLQEKTNDQLLKRICHLVHQLAKEKLSQNIGHEIGVKRVDSFSLSTSQIGTPKNGALGSEIPDGSSSQAKILLDPIVQRSPKNPSSVEATPPQQKLGKSVVTPFGEGRR